MQIITRKFNNETYNKLKEQGLSPIMAQIYAQRGINTTKELDYSLKELLPVNMLKNIMLAVKILEQAIINNQKITIVGDYDCDGATATAVAIKSLKMFGAKNVSYFVPDRQKDGYGLSKKIVENLIKKNKPDLIITVDNGITSFEGIEFANELGIKVLVTDHHLAMEKLPNACCIVNPNQPGDNFGSKNLAGVGVIFYVMLTLKVYLERKEYFKKNNLVVPQMTKLLDLVALGTVADCVVLDKNNRILVNNGLKQMREGNMQLGLKELFLQSDIYEFSKITINDLGFKIAPKINACGRLDNMRLGIDCLIETDDFITGRNAQILTQINDERKQMVNSMKQQAIEYIEKIDFKNKNHYSICVFNPDWHEGVVGIIASQLKEKYMVPTLVFTKSNNSDIIKASGRSISQIHLKDSLDLLAQKAPNMIVSFGGHAMAAGISIYKKDFEEFSKLFEQIIFQQMQIKPLNQEIQIDGELTNEELNLENAFFCKNSIWGQNFPYPTFKGEFEVIEQRILKDLHLKLTLKRDNKIFSAIQFFAPNLNIEQAKIQIIYKLDVNEYMGNKNIQLLIEKILDIPTFENNLSLKF